jgi:hypothetical protein
MTQTDVEVIRPATSGKSASQHIRIIVRARSNLRASFYHFVEAVCNAHAQLGSDAFDQDVAKVLNMSPSWLNRVLQIGGSPLIHQHRESLPEVQTTLYKIVQLEGIYKELPDENGREKLEELIANGTISTETESQDIDVLLEEIKKRIRGKKIETLDRFSADTISITLNELIAERVTFSSFVIDLTESSRLFRQWKSDGFFDEDIKEEFPLGELRSISLTNPVSCLIRVKMADIKFGLKIIEAFGFTYRDTIVDANGISALRNEIVIIRAERGQGSFGEELNLESTDLDDVLDMADRLLIAPHILVFEDTQREGWTCLLSPSE